MEKVTEQSIEDRSSLIFQFNALFDEYNRQPNDYGTGTSFNLLEIHVLSKIAHSPSITANELTQVFRKSKGFISKILSKLEDLGLIYKIKAAGNNKALHLYVTEKGKQYALAHDAHDNISYIQMKEEILKEVPEEQFDNFFVVLRIMCNLYQEALD